MRLSTKKAIDVSPDSTVKDSIEDIANIEKTIAKDTKDLV